ncbi:MAG TPA: pseudouridine synthase [Syntrophomonadaceae bacterium]|nr:pseudouridine synthase [Syntrophomonadaceae bacterium]
MANYENTSSMKIAHYLARAGIASRRKAEQMVRDKRVKVNGSIIDDPAVRIKPYLDKVEVDSGSVAPEKFVYILLNKPEGYLSAVSDTRGRPTVVELVPDGKRVYPVGRLDFDSQGLLLLTNDGDFTNHMIHPRYKIEKTYCVWVKGIVKTSELDKLQKGIMLEDGLTAPARAGILEENGGNTLLEITIHEGRKRQIKRMCAAVSHPVLSLTRTGFGFLTLEGVKTGEFRYLNKTEVNRLNQLAGKR